LTIKILLQNFLELSNDALHKCGHKTANINIKNCTLSTVLKAMDKKTAKIIKRFILLNITLTFSFQSICPFNIRIQQSGLVT